MVTMAYKWGGYSLLTISNDPSTQFPWHKKSQVSSMQMKRLLSVAVCCVWMGCLAGRGLKDGGVDIGRFA